MKSYYYPFEICSKSGRVVTTLIDPAKEGKRYDHDAARNPLGLITPTYRIRLSIIGLYCVRNEFSLNELIYTPLNEDEIVSLIYNTTSAKASEEKVHFVDGIAVATPIAVSVPKVIDELTSLLLLNYPYTPKYKLSDDGAGGVFNLVFITKNIKGFKIKCEYLDTHDILASGYFTLVNDIKLFN